MRFVSMYESLASTLDVIVTFGTCDVNSLCISATAAEA